VRREDPLVLALFFGLMLMMVGYIGLVWWAVRKKKI